MDSKFDFDKMTVEELHVIKRDDRCDNGRFENDAIFNKAIYAPCQEV